MKQAATRHSDCVPYIARCTSETKEQAIRRKLQPLANGGSRRRRKIASQRMYTWQIDNSEVKRPVVMGGMGDNTLHWFSDCYLRSGFLRPHTQTDYMRWLRLAPDRAPTLSRVPRAFTRLSRGRDQSDSGIHTRTPDRVAIKSHTVHYLLVPLYCHRTFPCAIFPVGRGGLGQIALRKLGSTALTWA